ncbi:plectin [Cyclospora cayetanensis]|uniref:Plectin n=1 Tax=Cyclospora cayetanensis TaxID=88456 RepID=A0A6P6RRV9_9EIME|nr:plectin [Cyclospora cayetanensis]
MATYEISPALPLRAPPADPTPTGMPAAAATPPSSEAGARLVRGLSFGGEEAALAAPQSLKHLGESLSASRNRPSGCSIAGDTCASGRAGADAEEATETSQSSASSPRGCRLTQLHCHFQSTFPPPSAEGSKKEAHGPPTDSLCHKDSIRFQVFRKLQEQREQQEWEAQQALEQQAASLRQQLAFLQKQLRAQQQESALQQQLLQQREAALQQAAAESEKLREREQRLRQERETLLRAHAALQQQAEKEQLTARSQRADAALEWAKKLTSEREAFKTELKALQRSREACADSARKLQDEVLLLRQQLRAAAAHTATLSPRKQHQRQKLLKQPQRGVSDSCIEDNASGVSAEEPLLKDTPSCHAGSSRSLPVLPVSSPRLLRMHLSQQQLQQQQTSDAESLPSLAAELSSPQVLTVGCSDSPNPQQQQKRPPSEDAFVDLEAGTKCPAAEAAAPLDDCCTKQLTAFTRLLMFLWNPVAVCPRRRSRARSDSL